MRIWIPARQIRCLVLALACVLAVACGKKGPPLPPLLRIPGVVPDVGVARYDQDVFVRFTVPTVNADGHSPADIARVEVYAITSARAPAATDDPEELRKLSTLIYSERVRRTPPPLPPAKPGEPPRPPLPPLPGVDQGTPLMTRETLTADTRVPVTIPEPKLPGPAPVVIEPPPRPVVAPLEQLGPLRYYYVVAVSPSERYGLMGQVRGIPLDPTSSAMAAPEVTYDETSLTIRWKAPPNARGGVPVEEEPGLLPWRSLIPALPPTTYDVSEVASPRNASPAAPTAPAPGNASPVLPAALTPAPVGGADLTQPLSVFGVERCFVVRPVDIVGGIHVRGAPSPMTCVMLTDTFAPDAPKSLGAVATAGQISLLWEPNEDSDLAGYVVLRGEAPGATLTPLFPDPIRESSWRDTTARPGVRYVYAVVAVDQAGNRSMESERVEETARPQN